VGALASNAFDSFWSCQSTSISFELSALLRFVSNEMSTCKKLFFSELTSEKLLRYLLITYRVQLKLVEIINLNLELTWSKFEFQLPDF